MFDSGFVRTLPTVGVRSDWTAAALGGGCTGVVVLTVCSAGEMQTLCWRRLLAALVLSHFFESLISTMLREPETGNLLDL
jgi:hypothetical protein